MAEGPDTPGMVEPGYVPPLERQVPTEGPDTPGMVEPGYTPPVQTPAQAKAARAQARGAPVFPTAAPAPVPAPAAAPVMTATQTDAWALIQTELNKWGLGGLSGTMKDLIINGAGTEETYRVIRDTNDYKVRFAGMEARRKAGFNAIDERTYLGMEDDYRSTMRAYGMPVGLYDDPSDFATYIGNNISADEFNTRVADGYQWAMEADPFEKAQLQSLYGLSNGDFAAMALDPDKAVPFLEKRRIASEIAAQGARTGWGQLTTQQAENLQTMGITEQQAAQGFGQLRAMTPLFQESIGDTGGDITQEEQLGAQFGGDVTQQQRITRRQRQRQNASQAGGTAVTTGAGITGLGSVS